LFGRLREGFDMNRRLCLSAVVFCFSFFCCGKFSCDSEIFFVDSGKLLRESKKGKSILLDGEERKKDLMNLERRRSKDIADAQNDIRSDLGSGLFKEEDDLVQEKLNSLGRKQKDITRELEDKKEEAGRAFEKSVTDFRKKVYSTAAREFNDHAVLDLAPLREGIVHIPMAKDKNDEIQRLLDKDFEVEKKKMEAKSSIVSDKAKKA
jgi:hypothetical protein